MAEDQEFEVVEAPPPECPSCGEQMLWDETIPIEGGAIARCPACDHLTPVWVDEPETEY